MDARSPPFEAIRSGLREEVRAIFNDRSRGERPVTPSDDALFARGSPIRRVHGDVVAMMAGGMAALVMQMLHPAALRGVLDHSAFRDDMHGRLRRTARFIAVTTFGERDAAAAAIERVRAIHGSVRGTMADGTPYRADDPHLLGWVHLAEAQCFLAAFRRYGDPRLSPADQDEYFAQSALVARLLGADPVPLNRRAAEMLMRRYRPELHADETTRHIADLVLRPAGGSLRGATAHAMLGLAALDLLPRWARRMIERDPPPLARLPGRLATVGLGAAVRWAFR